MYKEVYRYQFYVSIYDVTNYFSTMCVFPVGWEVRGAGQGWTETSEGDLKKKKKSFSEAIPLRYEKSLGGFSTDFKLSVPWYYAYTCIQTDILVFICLFLMKKTAFSSLSTHFWQ